MKRSILIDVLFIVLMGGVLLLITETGHADLLNKYIVVFLLGAYFTGKYVASRKWNF